LDHLELGRDLAGVIDAGSNAFPSAGAEHGARRLAYQDSFGHLGSSERTRVEGVLITMLWRV